MASHKYGHNENVIIKYQNFLYFFLNRYSPRLTNPEPISKIITLLLACNSTQEVLPPNLEKFLPGVGILPLTPQNFIFTFLPYLIL